MVVVVVVVVAAAGIVEAISAWVGSFCLAADSIS